MFKRKNNKKGFTIVELTIVVAVIAILSAVLIPTFAGITKKARQTADEAAVRELNTIIATAEDDITDVDDLIAFLNGKDVAEGSYVPMSKGYSFVWATAEDKVMLYSEKDKAIVFPKEYAGKDVKFVTLVTEKEEEIVEATNKDSFANGSVIAVKSNLESTSTIDVAKDLVVDLTATLKNTTANDDESNGVFQVVSGATLTLNGDGTVDALTNSNYHMAIWANGGDVVINGGTYTNVGAQGDQNDLIYAKNGGKITINGGSFKCATPAWTINNNNAHARPGTIVIKGGEFFEFDPSADVVMPDGRTHAQDGIIVAEGYKVVPETREDGTWYKVVKA